MPHYQASIQIDAPPEKVFAYLSDLTRHPEWAADPLTVEGEQAGAVAVGSRYHSVATTSAGTFHAALEVTEYQPPTTFGFSVQDETGAYHHRFTLTPRGSGTEVTREIEATLSLPQTLFFWLVFPFRKRPYTEEAMRRLKARLEAP